jgi:predicted nucleotidyltransferase
MPGEDSEKAAARAELLRRAGAALAAHPEVQDAYLFGSQARLQGGSLSDVDIAVYVDPLALDRPGFGIAAELGSDLQAALGRTDVDVVILNHAPPLLYHRVLRDGVRILSRCPTATTTREGRALSRYCDYLPQLRKIEAAHQARIAAGRFGR